MRLPPLPAGSDPNMQKYLRDLSTHVQMEFNKRTPDITARNSITLLSPDGSAWEVTVDDLGALITTKVQG